MDDGGDPAHGVAKRRRIGEIAQGDLDADALLTEPARIPDQAANGLAVRDEASQNGGSDQSRGAGQQDHGCGA